MKSIFYAILGFCAMSCIWQWVLIYQMQSRIEQLEKKWIKHFEYFLEQAERDLKLVKKRTQRLNCTHKALEELSKQPTTDSGDCRPCDSAPKV